MKEAQPTVFIIDDDPSARKGLSRLVRVAGLAVETFASAKAFLDRPPGDCHGCILLDVKMPEKDGLELQEELVRADCPLPIVFISGHADVPIAARAMKKGATDFLTKPVDRDELLDAIDHSLAKDRENRKNLALWKEARRQVATLSPREYEVMTFVIAGLLNKQIACAMGITEDTVKIHRGRVMKKMNVVSVPDLVRCADLAGVAPVKVDE
jgi:FixJ family two-component response regulator